MFVVIQEVSLIGLNFPSILNRTEKKLGGGCKRIIKKNYFQLYEKEMNFFFCFSEIQIATVFQYATIS